MAKFMLGQIPLHGPFHISTEFVIFVGPLLPLRSMYVMHESMSRSPGATHYKTSGISLPLQLSSVLLGYLRVWLAFACVASPFVMFWGESLDWSRPEWRITALLFSCWLAVLLLPGIYFRLGAAKRDVLHEATGLYLDPERFDAMQRASRTDDLADALTRSGVDLEAIAPDPNLLGLLAPDTLKRVYAYARYASLADAQWRPVAEAAWARLENMPASA